MGTRLDETCNKLTQLSSTLRSDSATLEEGRKDRKQWKKQQSQYHGLDNPLGAAIPAKKAKKAKKAKAPEVAKAATPRTPAIAMAQPQAVKVVSDGGKPPVPSKKLTFSLGTNQTLDSKSKQSPTSSASSRLTRFKGLLKSIGGRVAGLKRRLMDDVYVSRTYLMLNLDEQRSSTTFKKCPRGAMISTKGMRQSIPKNQFVKPDKDNPTFAIRPGCRAGKAGTLRALQKDMSNADEATAKQTIKRINAQGGTRGKDRLRAWGTGTAAGGKRFDTYDAKGQKAKSLAKRLGISRKKAAKLHGVSTGKPDNQKHTSPYSPPGGSKGPAGNREVPRYAKMHKAKSKKTNRSKERTEKREAGTIKRGRAKIGR